MPRRFVSKLTMLIVLGLLPLLALPVSAQSNDQALMLYSNSPESVFGPALLYQYVARGPARLLFHHLNLSGGPLVLEVQITNLSARTSAFLAYTYSAQHIDPTQAGHHAAQAFWQEQRRLLPSPAVGAYATETLLSVAWPPGITTSGLAVLDLPESALVRVLALPASQVMPYPARPLSGAAFPLTDIWEEAAYSIPQEPLVLSVGRANYLNNTTGVLRGNYGVIHHYRLLITNTSNQPQRLEIHTRQAGGVSRAFVRVNGTLLAMPTSATYEKRLLTYTIVPAHGQLTITLETMPQAGSNMPIDFIIENAPAAK